MTASQTCDICAHTATKICGSCRRTYYCSREHQKMVNPFVRYATNSQAWPVHKALCNIYRGPTSGGSIDRLSIVDELTNMEEDQANKFVKLILDRSPYSAGTLLLFLSILGCEPMDKRFFKRAAEHSFIKIMISANKLPEPLQPFITVVNDKWVERHFHDALSVLVAQKFVRILDDNDVFSVDSSMHRFVLRAIDSETTRDVAGYATVLVGATMFPDPQSTGSSSIMNITAQLDTCRNYSLTIMPTLDEATEEWEFWSTAVMALANAYRNLCDFPSAEELFHLSIGSGNGLKHWQAKFDLALMEGVNMNKWADAKIRLSEAVNQGLPRKETTTKCLDTIRDIIRSWNVDRNDKALEVEHLKGLTKLIFDGMKNEDQSQVHR